MLQHIGCSQQLLIFDVSRYTGGIILGLLIFLPRVDLKGVYKVRVMLIETMHISFKYTHVSIYSLTQNDALNNKLISFFHYYTLNNTYLIITNEAKQFLNKMHQDVSENHHYA